MSEEENNPFANEEAKEKEVAPATIKAEIKSEAVIKAAEKVEEKKVEEPKEEPKKEEPEQPKEEPKPLAAKDVKGVGLKITIAHDALKKCMAQVGELISEATLKLSEEKMSLISMDPANVCMVLFEMPAKSCAQWEVPKGGAELPILLSDLNKVLKRVGSSDITILEMNKNLFTVTIKRGNASPVYNIPLIEIEDKQQKIPSLTFNESVTMDTKYMMESFKDFAVVEADGVTFEVKGGRYNISSSADMKGVKIEFKQDGDKIVIPAGGTGANSRFSVEYLSKIFKSTGKKIKLELGNDYPLKVSFLETDDKYNIQYILAPRVDND